MLDLLLLYVSIIAARLASIVDPDQDERAVRSESSLFDQNIFSFFKDLL